MSLIDQVNKVVAKVTKIPEQDLSLDSGLGLTTNWDSLNHTTLVLELEETFEIAFDFDELDKIVTIRQIVDSLNAKGLN
tara:strand:- start:193 stop:429 length:237 start_codon:yes stop_codon:yes gene_type:complete